MARLSDLGGVGRKVVRQLGVERPRQVLVARLEATRQRDDLVRAFGGPYKMLAEIGEKFVPALGGVLEGHLYKK
jgi:hypothetical protein